MADDVVREFVFLASTPRKYAISGSYATPANPGGFSGLAHALPIRITKEIRRHVE
jgi:hypothetical protein